MKLVDEHSELWWCRLVAVSATELRTVQSSSLDLDQDPIL
jgi:hypothetical protein